MSNQLSTVEILLIEDNPADARLTMEALRDANVKNNLHVMTDGVEAMSFLRREGKYSDAVRPDLILLDLNLPKKNGHEVLLEIKADESLLRIPVVMLTTSSAEKDILAAYDRHVNAYVTKPIDLNDFFTAVKGLEDFWLSIVRLPPDGD